MSFLVGYYVLAVWTEPSATPPGSNVDAPINVGTTSQTKTGNLTIQAGYNFYAPNMYDSDSGTYFVDPTGATSAILAGNVGIGTTGPDRRLDVLLGDGNPQLRLTYTDGSVYTDFTTGSGGTLTIAPSDASHTVLIGSGGTGKLTTGIVDPLYNIGGTSYATFLPGMAGAKEETAGVVQLTGGKYVIDFNELEEGSDLWLFYRITDFGESWGKLIVLLSAEGPGGVWYKKEPESNRLTIYSETASSVSYRLTAPRFDWKKWLNVNEDGDVTGIIVEEITNDQYNSSPKH